MRLLLLAVFVLASLPGADRLAPGAEGPLAIPGSPHPCVLYVPTDYTAHSQLPLILFLHGAGGRPTTWPFRDATGGKGYLIVGLSYGGFADAGAEGIKTDAAGCTAMISFIAKVRSQVAASYGFDPQRVFLTGLSMGGWGVNAYGFQKEVRGQYAGFAIIAAGAINRGNDLSVARGLPVLVLNGQQDANLPVANAGMPLLERAGAIAKQVVLPGQGHVPSQDSMTPPISAWLTDVDKAVTRSRTVAAVTWRHDVPAGTQAKASDPQAALAAFLATQDWFAKAEAGRPLLIFCRSTREGPGGEPSPQAKDSATVGDAVFSYPEACGVPAASRAFTCIDLDLSALEVKANPLLNQASAPTVILVARDRSLAAVLKGISRLTEAAVLAEMRKLLEPAELATLDARISEITPVLKELQAVQKKQRAKAQALAKLRDMPAKDPAASKAKEERLAQEQKAVAELDAQFEALRDKLAGTPAP